MFGQRQTKKKHIAYIIETGKYLFSCKFPRKQKIKRDRWETSRGAESSIKFYIPLSIHIPRSKTQPLFHGTESESESAHFTVYSAVGLNYVKCI